MYEDVTHVKLHLSVLLAKLTSIERLEKNSGFYNCTKVTHND